MPLLALLLIVVAYFCCCAHYPAVNALRPADELDQKCFQFPEEPFNRKNCIRCSYGESPHLLFKAGDTAIDFTLHDVEGNSFTLSKALEEDGKPVVMLWGMYTCPAFQGMGDGGDPPFNECSYWDEAAVVKKYSNDVTFLHLVGPEPHPQIPDCNFDSGIVRDNYWSTVRQPMTYQERLTMAQKIVDLIEPPTKLLVDEFVGSPYADMVSPVWCTYGLGARTVFLIGADGVVRYSNTWFNRTELLDAIDKLLQDPSADMDGNGAKAKGVDADAVKGLSGGDAGSVARRGSSLSAAETAAEGGRGRMASLASHHPRRG